MAGLFKERARKPVIPTGCGVALPTTKYIDGQCFYVLEVREPWNPEGYDTYSMLLTEQEMLGAIASWADHLARHRPKHSPQEKTHG
ncbi:hypothetical protein ACVWZ4_007220 [Bradyrhizobium sp. USDA 4472]